MLVLIHFLLTAALIGVVNVMLAWAMERKP